MARTANLDPIQATKTATSAHNDADHGQPDTPFRERYEKALGNPRLSRNLTNFQQNWRPSRNQMMEEVDFVDLRAMLKAAKTEILDDHDRYLAQFQAAAEAAGASVHHAADAAAANRIVRDLAKAHGVISSPSRRRW